MTQVNLQVLWTSLESSTQSQNISKHHHHHHQHHTRQLLPSDLLCRRVEKWIVDELHRQNPHQQNLQQQRLSVGDDILIYTSGNNTSKNNNDFINQLAADHGQRITNVQVASIITTSFNGTETHLQSVALIQKNNLSSNSNALQLQFSVTSDLQLHTGNCGYRDIKFLTPALHSHVLEQNAHDDWSFPSSVQVMQLPHASLHGAWKSLNFEQDDNDDDDAGKNNPSNNINHNNSNKTSLRQNPKDQLFRFAVSSIKCGLAGLDPHIAPLGRGALLTSEPGLGKTTLCRALAHELSLTFLSSNINNSKNNTTGTTSDITAVYFVVVDAQQLLSQYLGESGKMVTRTFDFIRLLARSGEEHNVNNQNRRCLQALNNDSSSNINKVKATNLIVVTIDEVETIAMARQRTMNSNEPGDTTRAVNAMLTQLDSLRTVPNVLLLFTSNIVGILDPAFRDRLDLIIQIPPPSHSAALEIVTAGVAEFVRCGLVLPPPAKTVSLALKEALLLDQASKNCSNISNRRTTRGGNINNEKDDENETSEAATVTKLGAVAANNGMNNNSSNQTDKKTSSSPASLFAPCWKSGRALRRVAFLALTHSTVDIGGAAAATAAAQNAAAVPWDRYCATVVELLVKGVPKGALVVE